jgi:transcriptional regulator with XRE-family HTH domain
MPYHHIALGAFLKGTRESRKLSITAMSKLTAISRRHLIEMEKGTNSTVDSLKKVMHALGITTLPLDGDMTVTVRVNSAPDELLLALADQLERGQRATVTVIESLRSYARGTGEMNHDALATSLVRQVRERAETHAEDDQKDKRRA